MKKKLLLLSTIATFAFALCGCDSKGSDNKASDKKESNTTTEATVEEATTEEATTEEAAEEQEISEKVAEATRGTVTDGVFTNDVFKVSFPVEDDWYICNDEEIATIIGLTEDLLDENSNLTAAQIEASTMGTIYDIVFYFADMQSNVNVAYINLDNLGDYKTLPATTYAKLTATQLESMGVNGYECSDVTTETFGNKEWARLDASTDQGFDQTMIIRKENGYMVTITVTYFPEYAENAQAFLNSLTEVK